MTAASHDLLRAVIASPFEETPRAMLVDELIENPHPGSEELVRSLDEFFTNQNPDDYPFVVHCPIRLLVTRAGKQILVAIDPDEIRVLGPKLHQQSSPFRWGFNTPRDHNTFDDRFPFLLPMSLYQMHHQFARNHYHRLYPDRPFLPPASCPAVDFNTLEDAHRHLSILAMMLIHYPD